MGFITASMYEIIKTTILNISPSPCGSTIGGDSSNITIRFILNRYSALASPAAPAVRRCPTQPALAKNARHRPQEANERNMQNKTNRSIRTDKYRYRHFERTLGQTTHPPRRGGALKDSALAKRDDCNTKANDSAISFARMSEIYLRQKKVSQLTRVTEKNAGGVAGQVRNRAGNQRVSPLGRTPAYGDTLNSAPRPSCRRPPPSPPYGEIPAPTAIPARPAPEQYPATSCAEKLRPDETKIPKTTTNRMKIYSFRILQIEIFYLFLSKCFPLMEKRPDHYRPKPNRMGTSTIVYTIFARRMRHASTRRSEGIIPPPIGI